MSRTNVAFDGTYLMSPAYPKVGNKVNYKSGVLLYIDVNKSPSWKTLLLHAALNKAVKGTKYYQTYLKPENVWHIKKAGNGYMVIFKHGKQNLLAWLKLTFTSAGIKVANAKIIGDNMPMSLNGQILRYRAKTYIEGNRGTYVYDANGNKVGYHKNKKLLDLAKEKKIPVPGKYCVLPGGKIIYDKSRNAAAYKNMVFANGKAIQFIVKERSYPQGQQSKLQPFWYLMANKK